uniref:1-acylglycerol-3-phosphate O-acyltransferase n=1 Tax=Xenopsylla cheopis TaxID=163159 RepID=A0A6M2DUT0_XENCH
MECCCCLSWLVLIALVVTLLSVISVKVRFYVKWFIFSFYSFFSVTFAIPFMLPRPLHYKNALIPAFAIRHLTHYILGITFSIQGLNNLLRDSGAVIVINHQSAIDLVVLAELWPVVGHCIVIVKKAIFYYFPFGLGSYLWGTLFVDRSDKEGSKVTMNQASKMIKENKAKLCVFPEGTRHCGNELLPFKKGAFHVAIQNQCPIQPIIVSKYYWIDHKTYKFDGGHNLITILPSIPTKGLEVKDIDDLIKKTRDVMQEAYKKTSAQSLRLRSRRELMED